MASTPPRAPDDIVRLCQVNDRAAGKKLKKALKKKEADKKAGDACGAVPPKQTPGAPADSGEGDKSGALWSPHPV